MMDLSLIQFDVISSEFKSFENGSLVQVELKFQRKVMYHLANTFLPTISLIIIIEITLFFDNAKLDMAVNLSLTIMLVMYTFYQSLSQTLPKTAYMKFIDYWLIFCLLAPFLIFIIESLWNLEHGKKVKRMQAQTRDKNVWPTKEELKREIEFLHKARIQKVAILVTIIFVLCYFTIALFFFYFP
jgi:hypothetical protein